MHATTAVRIYLPGTTIFLYMYFEVQQMVGTRVLEVDCEFGLLL